MATEQDFRTSDKENSHVGHSYTVNQMDDEISLKELFARLRERWAYLLSKWLVILIAGIVGGAIGLAYAIIKNPIYTATTTFVLEEGESGGGLAQYAGLASMIGIDLGGGGGGVFQGDNILELYKSRRMIQQTLLTKDTFDGKQQLLIDRYIEFNKLRESWKRKENLKGINFNKPIEQFSLKHDSLIRDFTKIINKNNLTVIKPDKKLSIIQVDFKSIDEQFSKAFTDNIVKNVTNFYVQTKTKKSFENLKILQYQADSVRAVLNQSIGGVAAAIDATPNMNPAMQRLRVSSQRKQVDVQASAAIYEEIVKNLELAKISFRKEQPLIQIIDEPILPLYKKSASKLLSLLIGGFLIALLTCLILLLRRKL